MFLFIYLINVCLGSLWVGFYSWDILVNKIDTILFLLVYSLVGKCYWVCKENIIELN